MIASYRERTSLCAYWLMLLLVGTSAAEGTGQHPATTVSFAAETQSAVSSEEESVALTLSAALALALRQSPHLAAFTWDIRAADGMIEQAGLRPNPEFSIGIEQETDSGFGDSEITISIAQPILLGRKRAKRLAVAETVKGLVLLDYRAARANVLAQTAVDFVEVLAGQEYVSLDQELVELAEEVARSFSLRVDAGQVSPLELSRAEVALTTARLGYEDSLRALEAARATLASNWGGKRAMFAQVVGCLEEIRPVPALEELVALVTRNPDLARWSTELAARRAEFTLERAERIPDLTAELGLRSAVVDDLNAPRYGFGSAGDFAFARGESEYGVDRGNGLVLGFSLPLPIFNRNQGRIAAAEAMVRKVSDQRRSAEAAVHAELASAYQAASGAYAKAQTLSDEVMPKVDETFEKIQRGYRHGKFSYLEVLDTQRTLFDAREAYLDALTRYHQGVVRMERLTGQGLEDARPRDESDMEEFSNGK